MYSKALMHETCMQIWAGDKVHLQKHAHSNGSGWRHLTFFTTEFNKSENFASFRSRISERKGSRGTARTLFMSFSSFGSAGQLPRQKEKPSLVFFHPPLFSAVFVPFLFFYFGGRLAGLSMAHICSSSLLVFTTALGLTPPRLMDRNRDRIKKMGTMLMKTRDG